MDILFINPPYERLKGFSLGSIPNGLLGLATHISKSGYHAVVYDADTNTEDGLLTYNNKNRAESQGQYAKRIDDDTFYVWREISETISRLNPRFVGVSLMTPTLHSGLKIASIAKSLDKTVLIGGPHVNIVGEKIIGLYRDVDFIFFGESEYTIMYFLKAFPHYEKLKTIKGLAFKRNGDFTFNGYAERIKDLDLLPFPDRGLLIYRERYAKNTLATIIASRGCPFKCDFCASVPIWGRKAVFRSPEHIVAEIKDLHDRYHIKEFKFFDDTFTIVKKNVIEFCRQLTAAYGEKYFSWLCLSHITTLNDEVIYWLKKAGCRQIHLGVETGSEKVVKLIHKGIKLSDVEKAVKLVKKHNLWVHTFFMIGIPYETEQDMDDTIDFIKKIKPDSVNLCTFTPYPGTELYSYCVEKGLLKHDDNYEIFKHIGHHSTENFFLENVSKETYRIKLKEILEVTTAMTNSVTSRKLIYRINTLTLEKVVKKIEFIFRKIRIRFDRDL